MKKHIIYPNKDFYNQTDPEFYKTIHKSLEDKDKIEIDEKSRT